MGGVNHIGQKPTVDVRQVEKMLARGMSVKQIAEKAGVSRQAIYNLLRRKRIKDETNGLVAKPIADVEHLRVDPETGIVVDTRNSSYQMVIGKMGDEKVSRFVRYHRAMLAMRQGFDPKNVPDMYDRFYRYLEFCEENCIVPNNMSAYLAIGLNTQTISAWKNRVQGTEEQHQFAMDVLAFFAAIHEQGPTDGVMNPVSSIFWQKAHDGMSDQPKIEVTVSDPLGEKRSAEEIADTYKDLPD